jgi:type IV pilus biogenesis protein CpaD/CtpE
MKRLVTTLIMLLLQLLTACGHRPPTAAGATPEEAAMRTVVLFTTGQDRVSENSRIGFVLTEQQGERWVTRDVMSTMLQGWVRNTHSVDVSSWVMDLNGRRAGATYGEVLHPDVAAVEVTFDNGRTVRDAVTPEGMFALMVDDAAAYCRVKVLDAQDQVLETIKHPECS